MVGLFINTNALFNFQLLIREINNNDSKVLQPLSRYSLDERDECARVILSILHLEAFSHAIAIA